MWLVLGIAEKREVSRAGQFQRGNAMDYPGGRATGSSRLYDGSNLGRGERNLHTVNVKVSSAQATLHSRNLVHAIPADPRNRADGAVELRGVATCLRAGRLSLPQVPAGEVVFELAKRIPPRTKRRKINLRGGRSLPHSIDSPPCMPGNKKPRRLGGGASSKGLKNLISSRAHPVP